MNERSRFVELDALRGLAATAVVFSHASSFLGVEGADVTFRGHRFYYVIRHSPLHVFWSGRNSVILFFVLSGFVLSLPWLSGKVPDYRTFVFRRICRIWIPYLFAAVVAISLRAVFFTKGALHLNSDAWSGQLTGWKILNIASLVGYFDPSIFDMATWSLVHEMRISLAYPILMLGVAYRSWRRVLTGGVLLSLAAGGIRKYVNPDLPTDVWDTLHYAAFFLIGYLLAANLARLRIILRPGRLMFICGLGLYTYSSWFLPDARSLHSVHTDDWVIATGSALLILCALSGGSFARMLRRPLAAWLGDVSDSLYLYHVPLMMSFIYGLRGVVTPVWAIALSLPAVLCVSTASRRWIEMPAIRLARSAPGWLAGSHPDGATERL